MGLGVLKLKTLFAKLRKFERSILFIDEIDSMASRRTGDRGFGGVSDMNMTLNALLTEMDGFFGSNMMVIGATNNDAILDPAIMRAGRMDRRIYFESPNPEERKELFRYYLRKVNCNILSVDLDEIAMLTANYSPAEIAGVVNEAALIGHRPNGPGKVTTEIIIQALERVSVGLERTMVGSGIQIASHDALVRLDDVIGIDDVKQDLVEVVDFLRRGDELRRIGAKIPKGVLLIGPPGVGKTMLAKAVANEAGVPFYGLSGSYFINAFAGEGAERLRGLYTQARKSPAAIVFIDEIDAISGTVSDTGSNRTSALNQLLVELDGLGRSNVITIGATNVEQNLDPAFMRSGRFDRKTYIGLPDIEGRKKIFQKYLKNIKMASEPDLEKLGKISVNFSGADIAAAVNEAAILAVRRSSKHVEEIDLEQATERISITAGHKLNVGGMNLSRVPDIDVKLDDVKGMDSAKAEAAEVVALLKHADKVAESGLKSPKGILLVGPPGVGKTMLAKAIANEAGVPFYSLTGGDFQSMWAGVGANRVRAVYEQARRSGKPSIVFIDEIDAIGSKRGIERGGGAVQDSNKTLNQLLSEMDGFGKHKVLTIGATNRVGILDDALLRPGRFDRRIDVPLPNLEGREAIIKFHLKDIHCDETVNALEIARMTVYEAGANLANIANEAGLIAIRDGRMKISQSDIVQAIQRVMFGVSYAGNILSDELLKTAYHEAGHAIVCYFRNKKDRIQVLTIVPSGSALGYMWPVKKEDYNHISKEEYMVRMEVGLGGYVAEEMFTNTTSSGPCSDLDTVASYARQMVREYGMGSFKFNVDTAYTERRSDGLRFDISGETAREIELEIKSIIDACLTNARELLGKHRDKMKNLAEALIEKETLTFRDIAKILEPQLSDIDIERELLVLAEKKLVGKVPVINLEAIKGLLGVNKDSHKTNGKDDKSKTSQNESTTPDDKIEPTNKDQT
jgi:ATP-dependent metalloprotease FtsH